MNVLIISTNRHTLPAPVIPLGACIVADAAVKAGHNVSVLDLMFEKGPLQAVESTINNTRPDLIGLSIRNIDNNDMQHPVFFIKDLLSVIGIIRRTTDAPVVIGGAAVGVMPEEILRYTGAFCAVTGDGEVVFPALLEKLSNGGDIKGLPGIAMLENDRFESTPCSAPTPDGHCPAPDLIRWIDVHSYMSRLAAVPVQTKLGCQFRCIYCTYRKIEGCTYRLFDVESVIDSVKHLDSSGLRDIEFVDNVFNAPYDHAMALCEGLAHIRHSARLQSLEMNPLFITDTLISAMEQAGFNSLGITVESAADNVLDKLRKGFNTREVYNAAQAVRRHRLPCLWIFMFGGPGETRETVMATLRFAEKEIRPQDTAFFGTGIRIYPGTELESVARGQGLLSLSGAEMLEPVFYVSPEVDFEWMVKQVSAAMDTHMNFISSGSIGLPFLPAIHRAGYRLGIRPPLWRHTRFVRKGLRLFGVDA